MPSGIVYKIGVLSLVLLTAYLLFGVIENISAPPKRTSPVSYLTDAQNAELARWEDALLGKRIGDVNDAKTFAEADLPPRHRLIDPLIPITADWVPERYGQAAFMIIHGRADDREDLVFVETSRAS